MGPLQKPRSVPSVPGELRTRASGQAIIEYILLVMMLAVTFAVVIRNTNLQIYRFWTGLASQVASPCAECRVPTPPNLE